MSFYPAAQALALDTGSLKELAELARTGAPQLALRRMVSEQPKPEQDIVGWAVWERQQRPELLFWMADSLQVLEQYDEAAYLYLKSATLSDPTAMELWAQTARYRGAKALVEAGLLKDARQIYSSLLRATRDADRKAVLENDIQRLHLVYAVRKKGD